MKTVKSLLLGAAAGFVALSGAQAADLPGKAAPAEYVRICDTYGAGFFFIPGTDTCLRVGGFVRADYAFYNNASALSTAAGAGPANLNNTPFDNNTAFSSRLALNFDARSNTEYGLLRAFAQYSIFRGESSGYFSSGGNVPNNNPRSTLASLDRAFIQFAGFTFGYSASFFNFYQGDVNLLGNGVVARAHATNLLAYTASFGSGFSATISFEDRRTSELGNLDASVDGAAGAGTISLAARPFSGLGGLTYGRQQIPDIVANLRVDQGWGSAQLMGAVRQIKDYGFAGATAARVTPRRRPLPATSGASRSVLVFELTSTCLPVATSCGCRRPTPTACSVTSSTTVTATALRRTATRTMARSILARVATSGLATVMRS